MPERDNDRLESFFKKVSGRPDISFNENDWKKLEARLDAKEARSSIVARRNRNRIAGASIIALFIAGGLYWMNKPVNESSSVLSAKPEDSRPATPATDGKETTTSPSTDTDESVDDVIGKQNTGTAHSVKLRSQQNVGGTAVVSNSSGAGNAAIGKNLDDKETEVVESRSMESNSVSAATQNNIDKEITDLSVVSAPLVAGAIIEADNKRDQDPNNITETPAIADKIKQKANDADSVVREKNDAKVNDAYGSGLTEHPASPRLSLLLSIAPDFSTVAFDYYTDPGQAVGLMLHYHVKRSWSFATGVVLSHKKYTGDGEDYAPPSGYWRRNTNGIIPGTVYGSCNVLEIPLMVQYAVFNNGKNKFLVGTGTSSYIMLNESYKYNFDQPNPGAKEGWSSREKSTVFFNVINVTAGFEHRIFPGLMIGVEPYLKIPLKGIGWSDLKFYSAGASLTLRYILLNQKNPSTATPSRGPG